METTRILLQPWTGNIAWNRAILSVEMRASSVLTKNRKDSMNQLFTHPMWTNKIARSAFFCILGWFPLMIVGPIFPALGILWAILGLTLGIAAFVLMQVAVRQRDPVSTRAILHK